MGVSGTSGTYSCGEVINGRNANDTPFETLVVFQPESSGRQRGIRTTRQFGGGHGVIAIANASLAPSVNLAGGEILYAEDGALKYRDRTEP